MYMPPISGVFMSSFDCQLFNEEEVFHKRVSVALSNNHSMHIASETQMIVQVQVVHNDMVGITSC